MTDFKQDGFMVVIGLCVVALILGQSVHFLLKAYRHGKELGMDTATMKSTAFSSVLFSITPALAIVATILALAPSIGTILPWIRLSVIGNLMQETSAASAAIEALGQGGLSNEVTDPTVFATVSWCMALGSMLPLIVLPLILKRLQKGMNKATSSLDPKLTDSLAAAAFIGLISAFVARAVAGKDTGSVADGVFVPNNDGAGVLSVATLVSAVIFMIILSKIAEKCRLRWLESFAMPIAMFAALGVTILLARVLPENISSLEWRPVAAAIRGGALI